eukprot:Gb_17578 [translate_table: standard]
MDAAKLIVSGYLVMSSTPALHTKHWLASPVPRSAEHISSCNSQISIWVHRSKAYERKISKGAASRSKNISIIRCDKGDENNTLDRRQLLLGSSSLGLAGLHLNLVEKGSSLPMPPPELDRCHKPDLPRGANTDLNCCPPDYKTAIDFQFPTNLPMRIRQSAHTVDKEYIKKYSRAVQLMKELPADDPRNFTQQANVHCAYCDGAYYAGSLPLELQVHNSWLFLPWHRWYLYFHERILAKLIGDDTFALPFWNWDAPAGMTIPPMYANSGPLIDKLRDSAHQPPTLIDLNFSGTDKQLTNDELIASNTNLMYRQIVSNSKTTKSFLGYPYRYGDVSDPGAGTLENLPHGPVHEWTGSATEPNREDMGNFYSAGRDPIFFAHHANCDRMWTIWKTLGGKRRDYNDSDFLNSTFLFYNEDAKAVHVKVGDALDLTKLRYTYQRVDIPWLNARPVPLKRRLSSVVGGVPAPAKAEDIEEFGTQPKTLVGPVRVRVKRPIEKQNDLEEVLVIDGIQVRRSQASNFDVFINLPEADSSTSVACAEYAGTFVNVPHHHQHQDHENNKNMTRKGGVEDPYRKSSFTVGITEILEDLGATEDESIVVILVPKGDTRDPIKVSNIKIEYD